MGELVRHLMRLLMEYPVEHVMTLVMGRNL